MPTKYELADIVL